MTTINYSAELNVAAGYAKVEWNGLGDGDVGQVFSCAGMKLGSIHAWGSFSGGVLTVGASNEVSPANFQKLTQLSSGQDIYDPAMHDEAVLVGAIRPDFAGEGGSVNVAIIFLTR